MSDLARVEVWANALIRMYLDESWSFRFDSAKTRAGSTRFAQKQITVSRYLAERWSDDDVHQTLLHEIAHAIAGPEAGHGRLWREACEAIGYVGGRTHSGEIASEHAKWVGSCPAGHEVFRFRRPTRQSSCTRCASGFNEQHLIIWRQRH